MCLVDQTYFAGYGMGMVLDSYNQYLDTTLTYI